MAQCLESLCIFVVNLFEVIILLGNCYRKNNASNYRIDCFRKFVYIVHFIEAVYVFVYLLAFAAYGYE